MSHLLGGQATRGEQKIEEYGDVVHAGSIGALERPGSLVNPTHCGVQLGLDKLSRSGLPEPASSPNGTTRFVTSGFETE